MDCQDFLTDHSEFSDGELDAWTAEQCRAHLEACPSCARYDRVLRSGLRLIRSTPDPTPSVDFSSRLNRRLQHMRDETVVSARGAGAGGVVALAIAASLAFAAWSPMLHSEDLRTTSASAVPPASERVESSAGVAAVPSWWLPELPMTFNNPVAQATPALSVAFPGPYSPLVVVPPLADAPMNRTVPTRTASTRE